MMKICNGSISFTNILYYNKVRTQSDLGNEK